MLHLTLPRIDKNEVRTIGKLFIDGEYFCYTLEDAVRDKKIAGVTAIPAGTYRCIVNMSNRFQKLMPLLLEVPGFEGVRIHSGNKAADTAGCILVGYEWQGDRIYKSGLAFYDLMKRLGGKPFELIIE